jgi:hypothetical protein
MGMTIDTAINVLGMVEAHGVCIEAKDIAVETMRKYQKIEELIEYHMLRTLPKKNMSGFQKDILEVIDSGNGN